MSRSKWQSCNISSSFSTQMYVPNFLNVYGSQHAGTTITTNKGLSKHKTIKISKSRIIALDKLTEPCSTEPVAPDTTTCIANYIEEQLRCTGMIHMVS